MRNLYIILFLFLFASASFAATYNGKDIDGIKYNATVFSYAQSSYYDVMVEFNGDECTIFFPKRGFIAVSLDEEDIDDPHNVSAYDYQKSAYWDIDLVDFD